MNNPIQNKNYIVKKGDTLAGIATIAYGNPVEYPRIADANNIINVDLIYPNQILFIPPLQIIIDIPDEIKNNDINVIGIVINGKLLRADITTKIRFSYSDISAAFSFTIPLTHITKDEDFTKPFAFHRTQIYAGSELVISGFIDKHSKNDTQNQALINFEGRSLTAQLIECALLHKRNHNKQTLADIARKSCRPYGIQVIDKQKNQHIFKSVVAEDDVTVFDFLKKLATKSNAFLNSNENGALVIIDSEKIDDIIADIQEGNEAIIKSSVSVDSSKLYQSYTFIAQTRGRSLSATVKDDDIIIPRTTRIIASDISQQNELENAAKNHMRKARMEAMKISITFAGWRTKDGQLWQIGKRVRYTNEIYNFNNEILMIQAVTFESNSNSITTILELTV